MTTLIQFAVLGLGIGAVYSLLGLGLVVIYGGSGVLNLSQGAMAMLGGYLYWELNTKHGVSLVPAFAIAVAATSVVGALTYVLLMRPLARASALARVVATLGLLSLLQGSVSLVWGNSGEFAPTLFPGSSLNIGKVFIPTDRLYLIGIAAGITAALWFGYRALPAGLAIRAGAENPRAAAALAWSPHVLATTTWALGAALAGAAGILIAPIVGGLNTDQMPLLVIPVTAAALVGGFSSFPLTFIGAIVIGVMQSELVNYVTIQGAQWAIPFILIVFLLLIRGKALIIRGDFVERLPLVGTGRVDARFAAPAFVIGAALILWVFPITLVGALTVSLAWATIMLSVVILLGYTNQLSFEQMAMAGLSALVAAQLVAKAHVPFELAILLALVASVGIGVLFALPALRTRGINLAVVTLGLAVLLFESVLNSAKYTGGINGVNVGSQTFFGISLDSTRHAQRYALFTFLIFALCALVVANVRRGRAGGALIAVRTNERAAAALGISVFSTKLFAFTLGATIAALGGIALGFQTPNIPFDDFNPLNSVLAVSFAVIGGVGYVLGPLVASQLVIGGIGTWILDQFFPSANNFWLVTIGGIAVIGMVLLHPDGAVSLQTHQINRLRGRFRRSEPSAPRLLGGITPIGANPEVLAVQGVTVRFGGVVAVNDVSFEVWPGEVVGLIGPNGAGKTTLIDAITGFVRPASGDITLGGKSMRKWPVHRRARAGISRSFQALELFEQSTVRENLTVASDGRRLAQYLVDILRPRQRPLSSPAITAVHEFELEKELDLDVRDLPFGHRRLVAVARAIAISPSILLLDEPAAGLDAAESAELRDAVRRFADVHGLSILLVEHDMSFVMPLCDRIVVLDFGRCVALGTPAEIRADPAVIAAYLGEVPDEEALAADRSRRPDRANV